MEIYYQSGVGAGGGGGLAILIMFAIINATATQVNLLSHATCGAHDCMLLAFHQILCNLL